jgi:hypothetical protein
MIRLFGLSLAVVCVVIDEVRRIMISGPLVCCGNSSIIITMRVLSRERTCLFPVHSEKLFPIRAFAVLSLFWVIGTTLFQSKPSFVMEESEAGQSSKRVIRRRLFTVAEDSLLKMLVLQHGTHDFKTIASFMPGRTARQARERYRSYLAPEINNGPWSRAEDILLQCKFAEYGPKWAMIATFFPTRSDIAVKNRWASLSNVPLCAPPPPVRPEPELFPPVDVDDLKSLFDHAPAFSMNSFECGFLGRDFHDWLLP